MQVCMLLHLRDVRRKKATENCCESLAINFIDSLWNFYNIGFISVRYVSFIWKSKALEFSNNLMILFGCFSIHIIRCQLCWKSVDSRCTQMFDRNSTHSKLQSVWRMKDVNGNFTYYKWKYSLSNVIQCYFEPKFHFKTFLGFFFSSEWT